MEIKTKFAIGDKIWTLRECKATEIEIRSIIISKSPDGKDTIRYGFDIPGGYVDAVDERFCFITKQQLIEYAGA